MNIYEIKTELDEQLEYLAAIHPNKTRLIDLLRVVRQLADVVGEITEAKGGKA